MAEAPSSCPLANGTPTGGYFKHRRRGEEPCRSCKDRMSAHLAAKRRERGRTTYDITCKGCGESASVTEKSARFCSNECWGAWKSERAAAGRACREREARLPVYVGPSHVTHLPDSHPVMQDEQPGTWHTLFVSGPCKWCAGHFTAPAASYETRSLYCSTSCARSFNRSKRGRFTVPHPVRQQIYERDGWQCQLCGFAVDPDLDPTDKWAATLDHIEPQSHSLFPDHSEANLRLAHRWCNSFRCDDRAGIPQPKSNAFAVAAADAYAEDFTAVEFLETVTHYFAEQILEGVPDAWPRS